MNHLLIIAGQSVETDNPFDIYSPFSGENVGTTYFASKQDVDKAIQGAQQAFKEAKELSSFEREEALLHIVDRLTTLKHDLAVLIAQECGKPMKYALGEVSRAIQTFKIAAEETKRLPKEYIGLDWAPPGKNKEGLVKYFPIGIVCGFTPFNFPLNLVVHKVAPAIAAGCPIIIKPSPRTPLSAIKLAQIIMETKLPKGMVSVVNTTNEDAHWLVEDEGINMFSFTGSPKIGWQLKTMAGRKRIALELGGNAGIIIADDADVLTAVKKCVVGGFAYSGQVCIHTQRIYVQEDIFDLFTMEFIKQTKLLKFGNPLDEETEISNMIDEENAKRVEEWVNEAVENGAQLLCGGKRGGSYVEPTVLTNTKPQDKVCCEEVFGPVVIIEKYGSFRKAVDMINNSEFGLQAGLFTNNQQYIQYAFNMLEVGGVIINDTPTFRVDHMPYGGIKNSGFGREGVKYAILEMMEPKILVQDTN